MTTEGDLVVPDHLYLRRKSFELGSLALADAALDVRVSELLAESPTPTDEEHAALDRYWAREHALFEMYAVRHGLNYVDYLPGRLYTYERVAEVLWNTTSFDSLTSVIDVGSGSAALAQCLSPSVKLYVAADISASALRYAARLAAEGGAHPVLAPVQCDAFRLPFANDSFDVAASLGLLEHFAEDDQVSLVEEAIRVSRDIAVFSVPNTETAIFSSMSTLERQQAGDSRMFPLESHYFPVNFSRIASLSTSVAVAAEGAFHIIPPRRIDGSLLDEHERQVLQLVTSHASRAYDGSALRAWRTAEHSMSAALRDRYGWFRYAVLRAVEE